jgi:hypothetical protein
MANMTEEVVRELIRREGMVIHIVKLTVVDLLV